jgi:hypothetical protein
MVVAVMMMMKMMNPAGTLRRVFTTWHRNIFNNVKLLSTKINACKRAFNSHALIRPDTDIQYSLGVGMIHFLLQSLPVAISFSTGTWLHDQHFSSLTEMIWKSGQLNLKQNT